MIYEFDCSLYAKRFWITYLLGGNNNIRLYGLCFENTTMANLSTAQTYAVVWIGKIDANVHSYETLVI